ncbi:hypothetical protein [Streptomyces sp. NPDC048361]|uniref:hypothetical protein n=1 Tax=Streptomyces sp. NPDC048361 TaxID=3154720 RepID=UPI003443F50C
MKIYQDVVYNHSSRWGAKGLFVPTVYGARRAHPWWEVYQPVGYDLNSRMGTQTQFASMVASCHAAGSRCTSTR